MQNPIDFFQNKSQKNHTSSLLNLLREYLQVMALKIIYQSKEGNKLVFGGGTALRICHNLPRYSEDLDFELVGENFDLDQFVLDLKKGFLNYNTKLSISVPAKASEKTVIKLQLKFPDVLHVLNLVPLKDQKLSIKVEIYTKAANQGKYSPAYVSKFDEYYPILIGELPTLFANKIGAIVDREYTAKRDYYDLLWYLSHDIEPDYAVLNELKINIKDRTSLIRLMDKKVGELSGNDIIESIGRFLENETEKKALEDFHKLYKQVAEKYLMKRGT